MEKFLEKLHNAILKRWPDLLSAEHSKSDSAPYYSAEYTLKREPCEYISISSKSGDNVVINAYTFKTERAFLENRSKLNGTLLHEQIDGCRHILKFHVLEAREGDQYDVVMVSGNITAKTNQKRLTIDDILTYLQLNFIYNRPIPRNN